jgi:two-component system OmpR family response regulator
VDDEDNIAFLVASALRADGYLAETVGSCEAATRRLQDGGVDLLVLDVMLPDGEGFDVLRRLRGTGNPVPVILLTARDTPDDRVRGLTIGGDDYVVKPFAIDELLARVRTVLRRAGGGEPGLLRCGDVELDDHAHHVRRGDQDVSLTPTEYKVLRYLMLNPGRVLSKAQILDHAWDYEFDGDPAVVETYVSYLRRKLDDRDQKILRTVRGVGYVMGSRNGRA